MPNKVKHPRIVYVEWTDSSERCGWQTLKYGKKMVPCRCASVGFLIKETKKHLTLSINTSHGTDQVGALMCIPKGAIKLRREVEQ